MSGLTMAAPSAQAAAAAVTAAFSGSGTFRSVTSGVVYAKGGTALTLTVTTESDTQCVEVFNGAVLLARQGRGAAAASWTFSGSAAWLNTGAGNGVLNYSVNAWKNYVAGQDKCTSANGSATAAYTLDNTAPTAIGVLSPAPNGAGWNKANVSVDWTGSDNPGGSGVKTVTPTADSVTTDGTVTMTTAVTDNVGNTGPGSVTVKLDKTAPGITGSRTPAANANGWNSTNVTVSFTPTDATSGIDTSSGPTTLTTGGSSQSVTGSAVDNAGNSSSTTVGNINIDKVAPTLSGAPTTTGRNAAGWYKDDVTVNWTAGDPLSGLDGPAPSDTTITGEGSALTAAMAVNDKAGNATTASSSPAVKIDRTAPLTTVSAPPAWNNTAVALTLGASDALSGVASTSYSLDGGTTQSGTAVSVSAEGNHSLRFWSTDAAGNVEAAHTVDFGIDLTSPSIGHTQNPSANSYGWNNTPVTVTFVCSDSLAGIASCTGPQTVSANGRGQTVDGLATDNAGNTAKDPATVSIDMVDPTITVGLDRAADSNGWYSSPVTATYTCLDQPSLSGIKTCSPLTIFGEGAAQGDTGTALDAAGNSATASVSGVKVDLTPPTITGTIVTIPNSNDWFRGNVTVHWTCDDNLSGVVACPADSVVTGEGGNLSAIRTVFDNAGHSATAAVTGIRIDRSAPSTHTVGVPAGWQNGPVTVTLEGIDNLSGVDSSYYLVDGAVDATEGASVTIGTEGIHTVSYYSVDNAGNVEDRQSFTVQIDLSSPTIQAAQTIDTTPDGVQPAHFWNNTDVTVSFTCADQTLMSGLAGCSGPQTVTSEGTAQPVTGTATDNAGNSANATSLVNVDKTPPVITGAPDRAPNDASWYRAPVTVTFVGTDDRSGVASLSPPATVVENGAANQSVTGNVTDAAGNFASTSVGGINIDATPPTLSAAPTTSPNANGWYNSDVTLDWNCDDNLSGVLPGTCPAPSVLNGESASESTSASVEDVAGNHTDATSAPVKIDRTAPGTSASSPSGWVNDSVTVTLTPGDSLSGVASTHYTVDGGAVQTGTSINLSTEGTHNITHYSVDNAGNVETAHNLQVLIDKSAPTITHALSPLANSNGWNNANVTVTFTCLDQPGLSGVKSCTTPQPVTAEGKDQVVTGHVYDNAGNHATDPATVSLDKTPPTIGGSRSPAFNGFGWNNTDVVVHFTASDTLSGVDTPTDDTTLGEGDNQSLTGTAVDLAGNSSQATVSGIRVDKTLPTISGAPTTLAVNGWYRGDVTIAWTCLDQTALSGIATCPDDSTIGGEGAALSVPGTATDKAGNQTTSSSPTVRIDRTAPVTMANAPAGWNNRSVTVTLDALDNLSGVASTLYSLNGATPTSGSSLTINSQGNHALRYWSVDEAGNVETVRTATVKIDLTNPTIGHTVTPAPNGEGWNRTTPVRVAFNCDDDLSGVAECAAAQTVTGDTPGQPVTGTATDEANNTSSDTATVRLDTVNPTISGQPDRVPNANSWYAGDVTVSFTCDDALSGIVGCTSPATLGEGAAGNATGTATDTAGNTDEVTVGSINIDETPPTLSGVATADPNDAGWYNSNVTVKWTAADVLSGIDGSGPAESVIDGEGSALTASASVSDKAGNETSATSAPIKLDRTTPATTVSDVSDWTNNDVTLTLTASDNLSGVAVTRYRLDSGSVVDGTNVTIGSEGVHTLQAWSVDAAGNVEAQKNISIKIDKTAPGITHMQSPIANDLEWNNSDVTVTFTCTDANSAADNSPIASCTTPQTITSQGLNQLVLGVVTDKAGNSATDPASVSIDKTKPTVSGTLSAEANSNGWFKASVIGTFTCADQAGLSGVISCPGVRTFGEGRNQGVTVTATDAADNDSAPFTIDGVNVDTTSPTLSGAAMTAPNGASWYNGDVTVRWTADDALSGIDPSTDPTDETVSGEGNALSATAAVSDEAGNTTTAVLNGIHIDRTAPQTNPSFPSGWQKADVTVDFVATDNLSGVVDTYYVVDGGAQHSGTSVVISANGSHSVHYWSEDKAGNLETAHTLTVLVDKDAPTISGAPTTSTNANDWYNSPVTVHFTCADQTVLSGVSSCGPDAMLSAQGPNSATGTAVDNAGNTATTTFGPVNIDTVAPAVSIGGVVNGGIYTLGAVPAPTCAATDTTSGVAGTCTGTKMGGTANGVATFTYTATATDKAGNVGKASASYQVRYGFGTTLFLQPVNDTAHMTGVATSVFNAGQTIPMKFQLKNAAGQLVPAGSAPKWLTPLKGASMTAAVNEVSSAEAETTGLTYSWDGSKYQYNWKTAKSQAGFYWRVGVSLDDGQTYYVNIGLK